MADNKGRDARKPSEISGSGWKEVMLRVKDQLTKDNLNIVAAGVAFYFFLAIFPLLAATISIYGLVMDPLEVEQQMEQLTSALPESAHEMLSERLHNIAQSSSTTLGWGVALSILLSLWSANKGTKSLFLGIDIAYDEEEKRSFFKLNGITLLFTIGGIVLGIICLAAVIAFPALVDNLGLPSVLETVIQWGRWLVLAIFVMFGLSLLYKIAPDRDSPQFKWVSWGSAIATVLWLIGSLLFSWYVNNFGDFDEMYGSVAAVIILLLWLNLTSFVILLGAEINSEMEHQTAKDTTVGEEEPMGERGAYHADRVAGQDDDK
ncbi:YihY/virulence factor BrkB family protein [Pontibacter diazotrophicus]|uniref:YihY/virulence factor BrkB family protein n=1 Tax=Pontibacter diazotrophicus TaxID=1400979 RepID=A0A3D8LAZ3_9BACT|nr:YihY/virulence factor BrkB family protein [Pontibacter diazotrophicus]RDV14494.1 YihY/virulence factor BrkB family protein [Pontibacter diazotrophicus]